MFGTVPEPEGITNPPIDELLEKVDSKYALSVYAAQRARQINSYFTQLNEGLLQNVGPLVEYKNQEKPLTIAFREIAHGLGVKETVDGKGTVSEALGNKALTWEDAKANVVGLWLVCKMLDAHKIPSIITKEDAITTFVANLIRSERFGSGEALGRAYIMTYNYLLENGAFRRGDSGKYSIDYGRTLDALESFAALILRIQATGDRAAAEQFEKKYGSLSATYKADLVNLRLENIPVDIKFRFEK